MFGGGGVSLVLCACGCLYIVTRNVFPETTSRTGTVETTPGTEAGIVPFS